MNTDDVREAGITNKLIGLAVLDVDSFVRAAKTIIARETTFRYEDEGAALVALVNAMAVQYSARVAAASLPPDENARPAWLDNP